MWGSYLRVPYEIIRLVNGQHSTNYITGPASHVKTCPDVGCFILDVTPPNTESPHTCAGNPVEILSGEKHQKEIDMLAPIEFSRYYRSLGRGGKIGKSWYHSYERSLNFVSSHPTALKAQGLKSEPYSSKREACVTGWGDVKAKFNTAWAGASRAEYDENNEVCHVLTNAGVMLETRPINTNIIFQSSVDGQGALTDIAQLHRPDGSVFNFAKASSGLWMPLDGYRGKLSQSSTGDWQFYANDGSVETYSSVGLLLSIKYSPGLELSFVYDFKRDLISINSNRGSSINFRYDGAWISKVLLDGTEKLTFIRNEENFLTNATQVGVGERLYHYEDSRQSGYLTGITDEEGKRYARWSYDDQGRAILSEHANGQERHAFVFHERSTTVTGPLGKQTTYHYEYISGQKRLVDVEGHASDNCAAANKSYDYYPNGTLKSKTDWSGNTTTYERDEYGREVSRTEAAGTPEARTITTEYHPRLNLPVRIAEPGRVEVMTYDEQGRLLSKNIQSTSAPSH
jgi:YD repeat-containing protein